MTWDEAVALVRRIWELWPEWVLISIERFYAGYKVTLVRGQRTVKIAAPLSDRELSELMIDERSSDDGR